MNNIVVGESARTGSGMTAAHADGIGLDSERVQCPLPVHSTHRCLRRTCHVFDQGEPNFAVLPAVTPFWFTSVDRTIDLARFLSDPLAHFCVGDLGVHLSQKSHHL